MTKKYQFDLFQRFSLEYRHLAWVVPLHINNRSQCSMSFDDFYGEIRLFLYNFNRIGYLRNIGSLSHDYVQKHLLISESEARPSRKLFEAFEKNYSNEILESHVLINGEYVRQFSLGEVNIYGQNKQCFHPSIKINYFNRGFFSQLFVPFYIPILDEISNKYLSSISEYKKSYDIKERYPTITLFGDYPISSPNKYFDYYRLPLGTMTFIANVTIDTNDTGNKQNHLIPLKDSFLERKYCDIDTSIHICFIDSTIIHTGYSKRKEIHTKFQKNRRYQLYEISDISKSPSAVKVNKTPNYVVEHFYKIIKRKSIHHTRVPFYQAAEHVGPPKIKEIAYTMHEALRRIITFQGLTRLEKEFYSPNYSKGPLPEQCDYRRTLYWDPNVQTDSTGRARVVFYNNSTCKSYKIDAQGITEGGIIMLNKREFNESE